MSRRLRLLLIAIALAALVWLLFAATERALALTQRFLELPTWLQWTLGLVLAGLALLGLRLTWWLLRPPRTRKAVAVPDRPSLERRLDTLHGRGTDTSPLRHELEEMDRRGGGGRLYVALFGEISTGKSSLLRALAPGSIAASDVRGGTTRTVAHAQGHLRDGRELVFADVPGSHEAGALEHETIAREEALRAHAVVYVCTGELTRAQASELRWLGEFGKPLVIAFNKADQWSGAEVDLLLRRLRDQADGMAAAVVAISAGGEERFQRRLADGRLEQVQRQREAAIEPLLVALARLTAVGAATLEPQRQQAVLASLHERTGALEASSRNAEAERVVKRYARRAIIGAMAAVAPGSDLVIQGVLATGLTRELAELYGVRPSDVEIEDFVRQARLTLRSGSSIVLAVAGNALKAFPGLGTLGGGVLHAFAYALIFDSLGRALATSLAEQNGLDQAAAADRLKVLLGDASGSRLRELVALTHDALRGEAAEPPQ